MKSFIFMLLGLTFFACGTKKNSTKVDKNTTTMEVYKVKAVTGQFVKDSSPILSIDTVEVNGNTMYVDLSYSGGCEKHDFEVIGSLAIAKSYPPIRSLQIVNRANGDACREVKKIRLEVALEEVAYKQEDGSEIYLTIEGWDKRISYKYKGK